MGRKEAGLQTLAMVGLLLLAAMTAACGGSPEISGKIATADGEYSVTKIELGDRFPADCSSPADCIIGPPDCSSCNQRLEDGRQVVAVWLEPRFEARFGAVEHGDLLDLCMKEEDEAYIVDNDGSESGCFGHNMDYGRETLVLLFGPSASAEGFTLFAPGNRPVDLGR